MATGIVKTTQTAGAIGTYTSVYTVPTGYYGVYNISFTNITSAPVTIRLYIGASTTGSQTASEAFEYGTTIVANGVFERTGIVLNPNVNVIASASAVININMYGIETSTT
jgi:hypothetical protein